MYKGMTELAENKLLLLYIFNRINIPMTNSHITQIVLENNLINYFSLQQYISELIDGGLLHDSKEDKKHILSITSRGRDALEFFLARIPEKKKEVIDVYLDNNIDLIKKDIEILSDYEIEGSQLFIKLIFKNGGSSLLELKFPVDSNAKAQEISQFWKDNYNNIFNQIMNLFKK